MPQITVYDDDFTHGNITVSLSRWQMLTLKINGRLLFAMGKKEGWSAAMPFYLAKCNCHGYYLDYPKGGHERLTCPKCFAEEAEKLAILDKEATSK